MKNEMGATSDEQLSEVSGGAKGIITPKSGVKYCKWKDGRWSHCKSSNHQSIGAEYSANGHTYQQRICLNCGTQWLDRDGSPIKVID